MIYDNQSSETDVAVIGAGMAGLVCAQLLQLIGYHVTVLEKSRGLGGRVATRRVAGTRADHGTRYLEPKGRQLQGLLHALQNHHLLEPWTDTLYQFEPATGQLIPSVNWSPYYVAPTGMNTVGKFLGNNLQIWFNRRVQAMIPTEYENWYLTLESTHEESSEPYSLTAKAVVVAIPAPQALMLLEPAETQLPGDFIEKIRSVKFDPCLSVIAGYPSHRQRDLVKREPAWKAVIFPPEEKLAWVGWDSSKRPTSEQPVFVFQSSAKFAQKYLDVENLQPAGQELLTYAAKSLLPWLDSPEWLQVHRWRYAFPTQPLSEQCLTNQVPMPIVCCGDWCGGNRMEGALSSGKAAAIQVNALLKHYLMPGDGFWDVIARKWGK